MFLRSENQTRNKKYLPFYKMFPNDPYSQYIITEPKKKLMTKNLKVEICFLIGIFNVYIQFCHKSF